MKKLLTIILFLTCLNTQATTYYVASSGNDANNGTSTSTPFKTIAKVNSLSLVPDDIVRFNGGDTFIGNLIITHSGTSGHPITYNSYGTGNATISGFTTVSSWTNLGSNIWESTTSVSTLATLNMVVINGINTACGRTPNAGLWYTINSVNTSVALSSPSINSSVTNWTGADMVVRVNRYTEGKSTITSSSGSNLNYFPALSDIPQVGYGFFIQNDPRTLDVQNEWYYNPGTHKIRIYSTVSPTNVQISTIDTLAYSNNISYITYSNLNFTGANKYAVKINNSNGEPYGSHFTFQGCNFDFNGLSAIDIYATTYLIVNNCTFNHSGNFAINAGGQGSQFATITNNNIKNTGMLQGMGLNNTSAFKGIHSLGSFSNISHNNIDSIGYNGLEFDGDAVTVDSNYVTNYTQLLDDGGGIYTFPSLSQTSQVQRTIKGNIVLYGGDAHSGTPDNSTQTAGIYADGSCTNIDVLSNTVANTNWGLLLNNNINMNYLHNTVYNCAVSDYIVNYNAGIPLINLTIKDNIFFAKTAGQFTQKWEFQNVTPAIPANYNSDSNYFARPIDDNLDIVWQISNFNLAMWRTYSGQDAHSNKSPVATTNVNQTVFYYNPNGYDSTVSVITGVDVQGNSYSGTTVLHAYSSLIIISTGSLITPVINWPFSSVTYPNGLGPLQLDAVAKDGATTVTGTMTYLHGTGYIGNVPGTSNTANFSPADPLSYSTATKTVTIPVAPQTVSLSFGPDTIQTYTGGLLSPTLTSTPSCATAITLNGLSGGRSQVGTYLAYGAITDPNSTGTPKTATFTILKATATINAVNQTFNYDGLTHTISYTTFPAGLNVTHHYSSGTAPSALGTYTDTLRMVEANYSAGDIVRTITIVTNPATIFISDSVKTFNNTPQGVTVTSAYTYSVTYNGSATVPTNANVYEVIATITQVGHSGADTANLTILPKQAILSWNKPANVPEGTLFSTQQLNATADVLGTWTYDFNIGQLIPKGLTTIHGTFTPSSPNYSGSTITQTVQTYPANVPPKIYITPNYFYKILQ